MIIGHFFMRLKKRTKMRLKKIGIPQEMMDDAKKEGGFDLWTRGGGLRVWDICFFTSRKVIPSKQ